VSFDQVSPLGELTVRWTGAEDGEVEITDEFDGAPAEEATPDPDAGDPSGSVGHAGESADEVTVRQAQDGAGQREEEQ
jgi:segregation and condensation protein A